MRKNLGWTEVSEGRKLVFYRELADSRFDIVVLEHVGARAQAPRNWYRASIGYLVLPHAPGNRLERMLAQVTLGPVTPLHPPFLVQVGAKRGQPHLLPEDVVWAGHGADVILEATQAPAKWVRNQVVRFFPHCTATISPRLTPLPE